MSFPKKPRYSVGDQVRYFNKRGNEITSRITWTVANIMELRERGGDRYRLYVIRGEWKQATQRGSRTVYLSRSTYRQCRASQLRKASS